MKKQLFCTIFFVLLISVCFGQKPYKVVFYNLENFFDTINDPEVKDDEFTPEGPKKWNTAKYTFRGFRCPGKGPFFVSK